MQKEGELPEGELRRKISLFYRQAKGRSLGGVDCLESEGGRDYDVDLESFLIKFEGLVFSDFQGEETYRGFENCSKFKDYIRNQAHFRLIDGGYHFDSSEKRFYDVDEKTYREMRDRVIRAIVKRAIEGKILNECLKNEVVPIRNEEENNSPKIPDNLVNRIYEPSQINFFG